MEWFLSGSILLEDLHPDVRHWWEPWADESGAVRNSYGHQLRKAMGHEPYTTYDQIAGILNQLSSGAANGSRRLVLSTWNALDMAHPTTPITNCHGTVIQLFTGVDEGGNKKLDMTTYQRSADLMLGVPHNWLQYWALFKWLAYSTGYEMGKLTWIGGDVHVYQEHWSTAQELIGIPTREIETPNLMWLGMHGDEFYADQFQLTGPKYQPILKCKLDLVV
jgi:thymidylate synthase